MNRFENRITKLEEKLQRRGRVPREYQGPYITWEQPQDGGEDPFVDIKAELMEKFGSIDGVQFWRISWGEGTPETP